MIVKMKFLSITGPKADIDRVAQQYLSKYEIHLENALSELVQVQDLKPFIEINPYKADLVKVNSYLDALVIDEDTEVEPVSLETALSLITEVDEKVSHLNEEMAVLETKKAALKASLNKIEPFRELHYNLKSILEFKFIRYRFGRISNEYYKKFESYVYTDLNTLFYKCHVDDEYVWGVYFVPEHESTHVDAVFKSLHFQRFYIPDEYSGTPEEAFSDLTTRIFNITKEIADLSVKITSELTKSKDLLIAAKDRLDSLSDNFDVRKLAACTSQGQEPFYILCGWMSKKDTAFFEKDIEHDDHLYCIIEDDEDKISSSPPTKMKNPIILKPFEMFIKMYGLPAYNEIDPTFFVALTYTFIFGAMFGDVGQGVLLTIGGFLLYKFKKVNLCAIIGAAGIFSTIFGFLYGSFFGFEDTIKPLWLSPLSQMTELPFIGKLNTVFIVAVAFGMLLIIITMIFHIINGFKAGNLEDAVFDTNGIAGLVFFGSIVLVVVLFMTDKALPAGTLLAVMFGLPLLIMAFKEPLGRLVERKTDFMPKEKGMYLIQTFFEMFEVLLSYFSNTISFIRIGAFAVSHAAMMEVVLMLAGAENGANPNWMVIILGNLFVCAMEGLIVGIQVLRLEYFELFSRFYKGTGREFQPFRKVKKRKRRRVGTT